MDIKLHKRDFPDEIKFSDKIAIDCEFTGLNIERDRLCLIQISNGDNDAHIIKLDKNNYDESQQAFSVIKSVEDKLTDGQDFAVLASEYSEDLITKDIGGDLDYFEKDIFPIQFDEAIETLSLNEYSDIIELEDTYHILKITEYNTQEPLPESQIKDELLNELIETESFALMNDDFSEFEGMLLDNSSIEDIAIELMTATADLGVEAEKQAQVFSVKVSNKKDGLEK